LNEFGHLNNTNYKKSHSKFTDKVGAEKSCPFIYDELPQFIINKNSINDSSAQLQQSTSERKEAKYSFSNKSQFYALPQSLESKQKQEQQTQTQDIQKPVPAHPLPPLPATASPRNKLKDYSVFNEYTNFKRPPTLYSLYSNLPPDRVPDRFPNESSFINTSNPNNMHMYENNLEKSSSFFVPIDDSELSKSKLNLCILGNKELNDNIEKLIDKKIRSIMANNNFINRSNNNSFDSQSNLASTSTQPKCSKSVLFKQHSLADGSTQFKHGEHFL
jgi:hypothetical protein